MNMNKRMYLSLAALVATLSAAILTTKV
jgi:hypothetical protein